MSITMKTDFISFFLPVHGDGRTAIARTGVKSVWAIFAFYGKHISCIFTKKHTPGDWCSSSAILSFEYERTLFYTQAYDMYDRLIFLINIWYIWSKHVCGGNRMITSHGRRRAASLTRWRRPRKKISRLSFIILIYYYCYCYYIKRRPQQCHRMTTARTTTRLTLVAAD